MEQFKLREKSKKQKASPACFNARQFLNVHRLLLALGDLSVLSIEARIGEKKKKKVECSGFLPGSLVCNPWVWQEIHPTGLTQPSLPRASAQLSIAPSPVVSFSILRTEACRDL